MALAAAAALTAVLFAVVVAEARQEGPAPLQATFTGEVTSSGPVYRLPDMTVRANAPVELALPDLIDRTLARIGSKSDPKPDA
jgi:hypothetical protein